MRAHIGLDGSKSIRRRSRARVYSLTGGKLTGQKPALKMKEVWSIRARLELKRRVRDLGLVDPVAFGIVDTEIFERLALGDIAGQSSLGALWRLITARNFPVCADHAKD